MRKGWFGPKQFGYGISAKSWQGWVATVVFLLAFVGWSHLFHGVWLWTGWAALAALFGGTIALTYQGKPWGD